MTAHKNSDMRQKRIEILHQIDILDKQRCNKCIESTKAATVYCMCPASVKVRGLGVKLNKLVKPRYAKTIAMLEEITFQDMTRKIYEELKEAQMTDADLLRALKVGTAVFYRWKRENGFSKSGSATG